MTHTPLIFHVPRPSRFVQHIHARMRSLDIQIDTIREVLVRYGLELSALPRNLPLGRRSRNIVLDTSGGKMVLKRYRTEWQVPTIVYGHSVLAHLARLNFPAPRLAVTSDGNSYVEHDGEHYALFSFIGGTNYCSSYVPRTHWLRLLDLAGRTLASLHRRLEGFVPAGHHHLGFGSYTADRTRDGAWYVEQLKQMIETSRRLAGSKGEDRAGWLMQNGDLMMEELQRLDEALKAAPLPRVVVHGDYGIQNLLFQRDGTVTVLDFELARVEWRLSDLVTSLARFRYGNGAFGLECMRRFMLGYQSENAVSADEWRYLPQVWRFRRIQRAVQSYRSYFAMEGAADRLDAAREALNQSNWALEHRDEILALNPAYCQTRR